MKTYLLLFLISFSFTAFGNDSKAIPAEVSSFISDRFDCNQYGIQLAEQNNKSPEIEEKMNKLKCPEILAREEKMIKKYSRNKKVMHELTESIKDMD